MKTALIVENFRPIAEIWELCLNSLGFTDVTIVESSEEVDLYFDKRIPDLVLMDINLPGSKDGIEITRGLQSGSKSTSIIVVSLHDEVHFLKNALQAGAKGYIVKNSPLAELKVGIESVMSGQVYICEKMKHHVER